MLVHAIEAVLVVYVAASAFGFGLPGVDGERRSRRGVTRRGVSAGGRDVRGWS